MPNGVFKATDIGTDIIILTKNSNAEKRDISNYFIENPTKILGDLDQKTNRFGRIEDYVKGNLDDALHLLQRHSDQRDKTPQKTEEKQLTLWDIEPIVEERKAEKEQAKPQENQTKELQQNIEQTLIKLHNIKFKSPVIVNEIEKYNEIYRETENTPQNFDNERIKDISDKLERLNKNIKSEEQEYKIQSIPEIKKGVLKYQFNKQDEIIDTGLQNSYEAPTPCLYIGDYCAFVVLFSPLNFWSFWLFDGVCTLFAIRWLMQFGNVCGILLYLV